MKRNIVIATVTAAALVGGGTATAVAVSGDDAGTARQADVRVAGAAGAAAQDGDAEDAAPASGDVTAAEAVATALKHTPGTAVSVDLDDQDDAGPTVWDVDVLAGDDTWHSVRIDPGTGKVLGSHTDRDEDDDTAQVRAALKGTSVTAAEAAEAASGKGTVTSVDLDDDGTSKAWEVETHASGKAEQEWNVDLKTGKVTADRGDASGDGDSDGSDD